MKLWVLLPFTLSVLDTTYSLDKNSNCRAPSYSFHRPSNPEPCSRVESIVDPRYQVIWPALHHPGAFDLLDEHHKVREENQSQILFSLQALNKIL